jgi:hypothetical protein
MKMEINGALLKFQGILDERTDVSLIAGAVQEILSSTSNAKVVLDFQGVRRANSLGIVQWSKFIHTVDCALEYRNVPTWLVEQLNLKIIALGANATVTSVLAPFYCGEDGRHEVHCLQVGQDIPILGDYSNFVIERVSEKGNKLEADFEPKEYFAFLTWLSQSVRAA